MSCVSAAPLKIAYAVGVVIGVGVALVSAASLWYIKRKSHGTTPPTKWRRVGTVKKINIFPVKSCKALKLNDDEEISCDTLGLSVKGCRDRALMLISLDGNMIKARNFPRIDLIKSELLGPTNIKFKAPGKIVIVLDLATLQSKASKEIHTAVGATIIKVYLCGKKYDKWFSKVILCQKYGLRLVHYDMEGPVKAVNARMLKEPHITNDDREVNATTYLLINLATIDELRRLIDRYETFRGSFELTMDEHEPFAEDYWEWVRIGDNVIFSKVAPRTGRISPKIDDSNATSGTLLQGTLTRLRTFKGYPKPIVGIHLSICQPGNIKVNDVVYVEDY